MAGPAFTDDNRKAYDAIVPVIIGGIAEDLLTDTIKSNQDFRSFYEAFLQRYMGPTAIGVKQ